METEIRQGDIFKLGNHRLMCGDSTKKEDIDKLINNQVIDLLFTDPPYGMKKEKYGVKNDNLNNDDLLEFNKKWITLSFNYLKKNGSWYCFGNDKSLMNIWAFILKPLEDNKKITFRNLITWDKGYGQGQLSSLYRMYAIADEKCLFVMNGVIGFDNSTQNYYEGFEPIRTYLFNEAQKCNLNRKKLQEITNKGMYSHWFSKSQWELISFEDYEKIRKHYPGYFLKDYQEIKKEYEKIKKEFEDSKNYFNNLHDNMNNVWHFKKMKPKEKKETGGHATPKPIELCNRVILTSSREGENVLDLFGGSGSILLSCEQNKRNCYMMELEPKWVKIIIQRWEKLTGKKVEKIGG